jgi:hypothetical protein
MLGGKFLLAEDTDYQELANGLEELAAHIRRPEVIHSLTDLANRGERVCCQIADDVYVCEELYWQEVENDWEETDGDDECSSPECHLQRLYDARDTAQHAVDDHVLGILASLARHTGPGMPSPSDN